MAFHGDKKVGRWLLADAEDRLKKWLLPKVPRRVETYHLTLSTIVWSLLIIVFSWLARYEIRYLWLVSGMIAAQYITDLLDGAVGRARNTGLVKWGYYMDHFLDYIFLCAIVIGYALLLSDSNKYLALYILALFSGYMVNSFLSFAATGAFQISYMGIGPTEMRLIFIIVNTLIVCFGHESIARYLPFVLVGSTFGLFVTVFSTQKQLWKLDMEEKARNERNSAFD